MSVVANSNEEVPHDPPQLVITDLCDHVLMEIFSYLDLHEKCFIIPQVCRRFGTVSTLCVPKEIVTRELQNPKWNKTNTSVLFRKIGHSLRSITVSYVFEDIEYHLNVILMEIRKNCVNIAELRIQPIVHMAHLIGLPTTIRKIELDDFVGSSLNLEYLNNLDSLHLEVTRIPSALDWIKVKNRLKNIELKLTLEEIPNNISTIDKLMTSISDNVSVNIGIYNEAGFEPFILLDPVKNVSNVKEFSVIGFDVRNNDVNKILQHFAETNIITKLHLGCLTCNSGEPPHITLRTIDALLRCTSLKLIEFHFNFYINSVIVGFMERLELKNIRLQYGFVGHTQRYMTIPLGTFKDIVEFVEKFVTPSDNAYPQCELSLSPGDRWFSLSFQVKSQNMWNIFSNSCIHGAPKFRWIREGFYVEINART